MISGCPDISFHWCLCKQLQRMNYAKSKHFIFIHLYHFTLHTVDESKKMSE